MRLSVLGLPLIILAGSMLTGCGPSTYELKYKALLEENRNLHGQLETQARNGDDMRGQIKDLAAKLNYSIDALDMQAKQKKDAEAGKKKLMASLQEAVAGSPCEVAMRNADYVITTRFTFEPGAAELNVKARSDLRKIANVLSDNLPDASLLVAGHADNTQIRESKFASNWELSGARAMSVMRFLVDDCKLKPEKIGYAGYGEFRPVADNGTMEGREQNRRVEIIVTPHQAGM